MRTVEHVRPADPGLTLAVMVSGQEHHRVELAPDAGVTDMSAGILACAQAMIPVPPDVVTVEVGGSGVRGGGPEAVMAVFAREDLAATVARRRSRVLARRLLAKRHGVPESAVRGGVAHKVDDTVGREVRQALQARAFHRRCEARGQTPIEGLRYELRLARREWTDE